MCHPVVSSTPLAAHMRITAHQIKPSAYRASQPSLSLIQVHPPPMAVACPPRPLLIRAEIRRERAAGASTRAGSGCVAPSIVTIVKGGLTCHAIRIQKRVGALAVFRSPRPSAVFRCGGARARRDRAAARAEEALACGRAPTIVAIVKGRLTRRAIRCGHQWLGALAVLRSPRPLAIARRGGARARRDRAAARAEEALACGRAPAIVAIVKGRLTSRARRCFDWVNTLAGRRTGRERACFWSCRTSVALIFWETCTRLRAPATPSVVHGTCCAICICRAESVRHICYPAENGESENVAHALCMAKC
jgi:hypothetical protein